ncbi:type II secretion system protein GspM [Candidatus Rariloculus sp.]|uniref:type II secretion system protein GspM n=1 Tax=Candidatus Rariloculus sp. TaxID=3101265 RepID=UPI003D0E288A
MRDWFANLKPRHRLIVGVGGAAAVCIVVWGYVWSPLQTGSGALRDAVAEKRLLLIDLQRAAGIAASGSVATRGDSAQSLVVLVANTAQSFGLSDRFSQTRPDGSDGINVSFRDAPFDVLIGWLVMLDVTYGVAVESASFNGTRAPGLVSGQLFLRRS